MLTLKQMYWARILTQVSFFKKVLSAFKSHGVEPISKLSAPHLESEAHASATPTSSLKATITIEAYLRLNWIRILVEFQMPALRLESVQKKLSIRKKVA